MKKDILFLPLFIILATILSFAFLAYAQKPPLPEISEEEFRKHLVRPGGSERKKQESVPPAEKSRYDDMIKSSSQRKPSNGPIVRLRSQPRILSFEDIKNMLEYKKLEIPLRLRREESIFVII